MLDHGIWSSEAAFVGHSRPDVPILFFDPNDLRQTARRFQAGFPGCVSYAVKANAAPVTLDTLVGAGISTFDVASPVEMRLARMADPQAVLHYNNPIKSKDEIAQAARFGIVSTSVDCLAELGKLAALPKETEIAVRFALPVKGAVYDFGDKFGARPDQAAALLRQVKEMGFAPALTFHPGTQCDNAQAWVSYIQAAAQIAQQAGVEVERLNVGGGYAANRTGQAPDLETVFSDINSATQEAFPTPPALVCEPGRAMVAEAFTLCTRVKAIRPNGAVFLNDGLYGGLAELRDMPAFSRIRCLTAAGASLGGTTTPRVVFGPSCDSLDRLPHPLDLPQSLSVGDYVLFDGMGAYSLALSTAFNGYGVSELVPLSKNL